jgi:hypothetical protein
MLSACHDTVYAPGFSEDGFEAIAAGDSLERVRELIGEPIGERQANLIYLWEFDSGVGEMVLTPRSDADGNDGFYVYRVDDKVTEPFATDGHATPILPISDIKEKYGHPIKRSDYEKLYHWSYAESPSHGNQYHRWLVVDKGANKVVHKYAFFRWD